MTGTAETFSFWLFLPWLDLYASLCYTARQRGNYFVVEKVKPDPLNLLVNTSAGKQASIIAVDLRRFPRTGSVFFYD